MNQQTVIKVGIGAVVLAAVIYLGTATFIANRQLGLTREWRGKMLAVKNTAEKEVPTLRSATGLQPLADACKDKLPPAGFSAVVGYVDKGDTPEGRHMGGEVTGWVASSNTINYDFMHYAESEPSFSEHFNEALDPFTWDNGWWHTDPAAGKYLAITVPLKITFPSMNDDEKTFAPGSGELRTRVLSIPDGKALCEGVTEPSTPHKLDSKGYGKTQAAAQARASMQLMDSLAWSFETSIKYTPLLALCFAADQKYCEHIQNWMH